jgi:hypothetical protein
LSVAIRLLIAIESVSNNGKEGTFEKSFTFGRYTSANLNVWLFNNHASYEVLAARATVLCSQHPLLICIRQAINRDNADTSLVVAAVTGSEAYTPSSLGN